MALKIVILAAGNGKRMHSNLPKVLHPIAGKPMICHVLDAIKPLNPAAVCVVCGHQAHQVKEILHEETLIWVEQSRQLGTGHAVLQALPQIEHDDNVLILYGDVPLIQSETLQRMLQALSNHHGVVLSAKLDQPFGYGRLVLDKQGFLSHIVEEKDASSVQKQIQEVNTGVFAAKGSSLQRWLPELTDNNAQKEYYLTDIVALAYKAKQPMTAISVTDILEVTGVNNRKQQAQLERAFQLQQANALLSQGVTLLDPHRFDIRGSLQVGQDVVIDANVLIEGEVRLGNDVQIGANVVLKDCSLGDRVRVLPMTVIEHAVVGEESQIGPFARLRPGARLHGENRVGNFVELKNTVLSEQAKVNHLTYLGDCQVGRQVNVGAGTITCNYDGANKHSTIIEEQALIGSGSQLVAPVTIGAGATVAAGSTITDDVAASELVLTRNRQTHIQGWERPKKDE